MGAPKVHQSNDHRRDTEAQVADAIDGTLQPRGVAVIIESEHHCMTTRGVHKDGTTMLTSRMIGAFRDDVQLRREFQAMAGLKS